MTDSPFAPSRDSVGALDGSPLIVSLSDAHGYYSEAESALLALTDHPDYDPIVTRDDDGTLHWAGNDYVLVFNGDLVDRGPDSAGCVDLAFRLQDEAANDRVRYLLGNHESFLLFQQCLRRDEWAARDASAGVRRRFLERAVDGGVTMAYSGHRHDYSHAGSPDGVEPSRLNDRLAAAAEELLTAGNDADAENRQRAILDDYLDLFGIGDGNGRGPGAGPLWLDFEHLPADAPPQIVGHTMHDEPTRKGRVVCENVVRRNQGAPGGEAVLVETPDELVALVRDERGGVEERPVDRGQ